MVQNSIKVLAKALVRVSAALGLLLLFGCGGGGGVDDDNNGGVTGETKIINGIECVLVKAGTFTIGSDANETDRFPDEDQHKMTITRDYWVGKYPVTQKQYQTAMGTNPSHTRYGIGDDYPVNNVSWDEAVEFCNKVGGRLLTEAEWEFAARGGNKSKGYTYSGSNTVGDVAWYGDNPGSTSHPVGQKKANELGIYDMSGNVWEWCSDWYGRYPPDSVQIKDPVTGKPVYIRNPMTIDPTGPKTGSNRVARGGSWFYNAWHCRVALRYFILSSFRPYDLGLRVAFDAN